MSNDHLKYLLEKFITNDSSPEEVSELFEWIKEVKDDSIIKDRVRLLWDNNKNSEEQMDVNWKVVYSKIIHAAKREKRYLWPRIAVAASIVGVLLAGGYFLFLNQGKSIKTKSVAIAHDITPPKSNHATLTLADGTVVYLDSASNGQLALQGGVKIVKYQNGQIGYQSLENNAPIEAPIFNTLSNPRGSNIIDMTLGDGSKVWLNSGSSITYPVVFVGGERRVNVVGEAYFEVVHDDTKPFYVTHGEMQVRVLGTHFNVDSYDDEDFIRVTLLEGKVDVKAEGETVILKPGEQAEINPVRHQLQKLEDINIDAVIAWKNGRFIFQRDDIRTVMRQLSRWYDVEVSYEGNVTNEKFVGIINRSRYQNISGILDMFEKTRTVSFKIIGRRIIVAPYHNKVSMDM